METLIEKFLVGQEELEKLYGCYDMRITRPLSEEELKFEKLEEVFNQHYPDYVDKDIRRSIQRTDKDGLIQRINDMFEFNMDSFNNNDQKFKLVYLFLQFEEKFGSKTLRGFWAKPSLENVDNSYVGLKTTNGEMMAFLKRSLENAISADFIYKAKTTVYEVASGWERQIKQIREQLDFDLYYDNHEEIERAYKTVAGYAQFYNKKVYLHGNIKHDLFETVYLKLLEHENLGREYDLISVANSVVDLKFNSNDSEEFCKELASNKVSIDEVDSFLSNNRQTVAAKVFRQDKVDSNELNKYDRAMSNVKYFLKMWVENTKHKKHEPVDELLLVLCIREILSLKQSDKVENRYYRAKADKTLKSELYDDKNAVIRIKSQATWVERVMKRYNSCFHSMEVINMARQTEKYMDYLMVRTLATNSIDDMKVIHSHFMLEMQGMIYPQKQLEEKVKLFERILRGESIRYKVMISEGNLLSPTRVFFSFKLEDDTLLELAKGLKKAISDAEIDKSPKFYDYELTILKAYFGDALNLYFEFVVDPSFKRICIQKKEILPYRDIKQILQHNGIDI